MVTPDRTGPNGIQDSILNMPPRRPGNVKYILYYLRHKPLGTIGVSICTIMILTAIFAKLIAPHT